MDKQAIHSAQKDSNNARHAMSSPLWPGSLLWLPPGRSLRLEVGSLPGPFGGPVGTAPTPDAALASLWAAAAAATAACLLIITPAGGAGTGAQFRPLFAAVLLPVALRLKKAAVSGTGAELRPVPSLQDGIHIHYVRRVPAFLLTCD